MPWIRTNGTLCGQCASWMEKYAIGHRGKLVYFAERCVTCGTQFNYEPKPAQVGYGNMPKTGAIKWDRKSNGKRK